MPWLSGWHLQAGSLASSPWVVPRAGPKVQCSHSCSVNLGQALTTASPWMALRALRYMRLMPRCRSRRALGAAAGLGAACTTTGCGATTSCTAHALLLTATLAGPQCQPEV